MQHYVVKIIAMEVTNGSDDHVFVGTFFPSPISKDEFKQEHLNNDNHTKLDLVVENSNGIHRCRHGQNC